MSALAIAGLVGGLLPILLLAVFVLVSYNRFVSQAELVDESWSQVDVELQRRHDLVPGLVAAVEGYAEHEANVLDRVTRARAAAETHRAAAPAVRRPFEEELGGAVQGVLAVAEGYPELRTSATFLELQRELTNTEDRIAAGRRFYNGNVRALNTRTRTVPSNLVATVFGFEPREFFEIDEPAVARPRARLERDEPRG
jgi:LemA protein